MAAAAIETLFFGNDALDVEADPGAVVIWFSDDPSLNDQTRSRLMQGLGEADLARPDPDRTAVLTSPRLEPRKVYFLNTQRLTKSSLLTRGHVEDPTVAALPGLDAQTQPDMQGWTIWQTIANTVARRRTHRVPRARRSPPRLRDTDVVRQADDRAGAWSTGTPATRRSPSSGGSRRRSRTSRK